MLSVMRLGDLVVAAAAASLHLFLLWLGPCSLLAVVWAVLVHSSLLVPGLGTIAACYTVFEAFFFVWCTALTFWEGWLVRDKKHPLHAPCFEPWRRKLNLKRLLKSELLSRTRGRRWLLGWFGLRSSDADLRTTYMRLRKGNVLDFFSWAWFDVPTYDLLANQTDREEVNHLLSVVESRLGSLAPGKNNGLRPLRQSVDSFFSFVRPHPLVFYLTMDVLQHVLAPLALRSMGFRRMHTDRICYWIRCSRGDRSLGGAPDNPPRPAILFLHGIGVGLITYCTKVVKDLIRVGDDGGAAVIIPEIPEASMSMWTWIRGHDPVSVRETVEWLDLVVDRHGLVKHDSSETAHGNIHLLAHSYGTFLAAWFLKARPALFRSVCLVDPVCLYLYHPDVCTKFLYKPVDGASYFGTRGDAFDALLNYVVRQEPGLVRTLMRNFWWHSNTLWKDQLAQFVSAIFLAMEDEYVPVSAIIRGFESECEEDEAKAALVRPGDSAVAGPRALQREAERGSKNAESRSNQKVGATRLNTYPKLKHGEWLLDTKMQRDVLEQLRRFIHGTAS